MGVVNIQYSADRALERLLWSVERPGDFFAHGKLFAPMPRLEVDGAGMLSFPVPGSQVRSLIKEAERAPYGKGSDTRVDRSVRDCWQIGADRVRLAGTAWPDTFSRILDAAASGLGCARGRLDAHFYKLLIYEKEGFFSAHRDTEKAGGMIATLSIALPTAGEGGELIVSHRGREFTIDMHVEEPSELAFAAFYADCTHETRPVVEGHRLSLVFNLCLRAGDTDTPRDAPDYAEQVEEIAKRLVAWQRSDGATEKLVWLLDHQYSEAGLSFDTLKNADAARARNLALAAERADCELYAAIVHIEEHGDAMYEGSYVDGWGWNEGSAGDMEMGEVYEGRYWLDGWRSRGGGRLSLGEIEVQPEELLPRGALDDAEPDNQWLHEATGNEGVTLERAYRCAALVIWPKSRTLSIVVRAGVDGAVAWVAEQLERNAELANEGIPELVSELIERWPSERNDDDGPGRTRMLALLRSVGDEGHLVRFLEEVILHRYRGHEIEEVVAAMDTIGADAAKRFLHDLAVAHFPRRSKETLTLLRRLDEAYGESGAAWEGVLRESIRAVLLSVPAALDPRAKADAPAETSQRLKRLGGQAIRDLFALAWRFGLTRQAAAAARAIVDCPGVVSPDRALPAALCDLFGTEGLAGSAAFAVLWRHAAGFLLARSATPPEEPSNWTIAADIDCNCDLCGKLRAFCKDPTAKTARFPLRKDLRAHLHRAIDYHRLDIDHETERRGRPYTLVCIKNRASHKQRLAEYSKDISFMRTLIQSAPGGGGRTAVRRAPELLRLHEAVAPSEPG